MLMNEIYMGMTIAPVIMFEKCNDTFSENNMDKIALHPLPPFTSLQLHVSV